MTVVIPITVTQHGSKMEKLLTDFKNRGGSQIDPYFFLLFGLNFVANYGGINTLNFWRTIYN